MALRNEAKAQGARIFFVDEAHFRAEVELRARWVLCSQPASVGTTIPKMGEKATYYSAVCLETGDVESIAVPGNTDAATSVAFLKQLREKYPQPLNDVDPAIDRLRQYQRQHNHHDRDQHQDRDSQPHALGKLHISHFPSCNITAKYPQHIPQKIGQHEGDPDC